MRATALMRLIFLCALMSLSACSSSVTSRLSAPLDIGLDHESTAQDVLSAEPGKRLRAEIYTPKSQQLMFRRWVGDSPFLAHYYFYGPENHLSAVSYYLSDSPYVACERHHGRYDELIAEVSESHGPSNKQRENFSESSPGFNCDVAETWLTEHLEIEVWRDGNTTHNFERVGIRYLFK